MANPPMPVLDRDLNERLVKVTNNNDFALSDMYDSVSYVFEPHKELKLPADAAHHIFGWTEGATPQQMFQHVQKRWGWNTPQWRDKAPRFWEKFKIQTATFKLVEVSEEETGEALPIELGARETTRRA